MAAHRSVMICCFFIVSVLQEEAPLVRLSYLLGTEPVTMLPTPYLPDKCASSNCFDKSSRQVFRQVAHPLRLLYYIGHLTGAGTGTFLLQQCGPRLLSSKATVLTKITTPEMLPHPAQGYLAGAHQRQRARRAPAAIRLCRGHQGAAAVRQGRHPHQRARGPGQNPSQFCTVPGYAV